MRYLLAALFLGTACTDKDDNLNNNEIQKERRVEGSREGDCIDDEDNDGDGDVDCEDDGCAGAPDCQETTDTGPSDTDEPDPEDPLDVDDDQDGLSENEGDCDDSDASVHPNAADTVGDGVDQNCDGLDGVDGDADAFAAVSSGGSDCDDANANVYPGADDTWYDGVDSDCAGNSDYDQDGDGQDASQHGGTDCDDLVSTTYLGATDAWYDGVDSDCAGNSDYDQDGDGQDASQHGGTDCDDLVSTTYLGAIDAWYDGVDSDCAGNSDYDQDGDGQDASQHGGIDCNDLVATIYLGAVDAWYDGVDSDCAGNSDYDQDGDGVPQSFDCDDSNPSLLSTVNDADCDGVLTADDCDDSNPSVTSGSANDSDCDGVPSAEDCDDTDATITITDDCDQDGISALEDCDDQDPTITSGDDCDGDGSSAVDDCDDYDATSTIVAEDADCDGVLTADDCDDTDATLLAVVNDTDCDGVLTVNDCDDTDATSTIVAEDVDCDGVLTADDCDDADPTDAFLVGDCDEDGVSSIDDCDDLDSSLLSMAEDADCDGVLTAEDCDDYNPSSTIVIEDQDCDGVLSLEDCNDGDANSTVVSEDADCDGVLTANDCDDLNPEVYPGAGEIWYDGVDQDCSGGSDYDQDEDGYGINASDDFEYDCNDDDPNINAGATEILGNGIDDDCDGTIDVTASVEGDCTDGFDEDGDGFADCDDSDCANVAACFSDENCFNNVDDDQDGLIDCEDADCVSAESCIETLCSDGVDNDGNGFVDCEDLECSEDAACVNSGTESLWVQLLWTATGDDLDLHLLAPGGVLKTSSDCYYANCKADFGESLDWGVQGLTEDDPVMDLDDQAGGGPENINILAPQTDGLFTVIVHDYPSSVYEGENVATITIFAGQEQIWTESRTIIGEDSYTPIVTIDWSELRVTSVVDSCSTEGNNMDTVVIDADCDGIVDADDLDPDGDGICDGQTTANPDDADCDGILSADDCDDTDAAVRITDDCDQDGVLSADDCDDTDATSTIVADDADCDGVLTGEDCDDADPFYTAILGNCVPRPNPAVSTVFDASTQFLMNAQGNRLNEEELSSVGIVWEHIDGAVSYKVYGKQSNPSDSISNDWNELTVVEANEIPQNGQVYATLDLSIFDSGTGTVLGMGNQLDIIVTFIDETGEERAIDGSEPSLVIFDEMSPSLNGFEHNGLVENAEEREILLLDPMFRFSESMDVNSQLDLSEISALGGRISSIAFGSDAYWESDETPENEVRNAYSDSLTITYNVRSNHTIQGNVSVADPYMWNIASGNLGTPLEGWAHGDVVGVSRPINDPSVDIGLTVRYLRIDEISTSDNVISIDPEVSGANTGDTSGADDVFSAEWNALVSYCASITDSCQVAQKQFDSLNHCWYYFTGYDQPEEDPNVTPCTSVDDDDIRCNHPVAQGLWPWIDYADLGTVQAPALNPELHPHDVRIGSVGDQVFDTLECRNSKIAELEVVPDEYQTATGAAIFPDPENSGSYIKADGSAYDGDGILGEDLFTVYTNADVYCPQAAGDSMVCKNDLRANDVIFDPCNSRTTITVEAADGTDTIVVADASKFFVGQEIEIGAETGELSHRVESVNAATNTLTLDRLLTDTQQIGVVVRDNNCTFALREDVLSVLNARDERLVYPIDVDNEVTTLSFKSFVSLRGVVVGDILLVEDDNGNRATATILGIRTINSSFQNLNVEIDAPFGEAGEQMEEVKEVEVGAFHPLEATTLPFTIDPSNSTVYVLGDALHFQSSTIQDTSGNIGIDPRRDDIVILNSEGVGTPLSLYTDRDGDGIFDAVDCDDTDVSDISFYGDCDQDGVAAADDCDDTDAASTIVAEDADCDGVLTADDCDDADATLFAIAEDADCDGVLTAADCDDADATLFAIAEDADCDGVLTVDDCDDSDSSDAYLSDDCDLDGVVAFDDCDDADATLFAIAEDADCDGVLTVDDCDDSDSSDAYLSGDCDQDGVVAFEDCDDADADSTVVAEDGDCDGVLTEEDCNDADATIYPGADDVPNDGVDQDCNGADTQAEAQEDYDQALEETLVVPDGVTSIFAALWGAGGAGGEQLGATGGGGGYVEVVLPVTPGETLSLYIGEGGNYTGAGGGATAIMRGEELLVIAGGGGGGASDGNSGNSWAGGAGGAGGQNGEDGEDLLYHQQGTSYSYCTAATGGTGATQTEGGIGGIPSGDAEYQGESSLCFGEDGASLQGGGATGERSSCNFFGPYFWETASPGGANGHPGAGGSGYYGGGGGGSVYTYCGAGGGGGSSWASPALSSVTYMDGSRQTQGNEAQSNGSGRGGDRDYDGVSDRGADGRIVLTW